MMAATASAQPGRGRGGQGGPGGGRFGRGGFGGFGGQESLLDLVAREDVGKELEIIEAQREDIDGNTGSDYRIQFSLRVGFDTGNIMGR